MENKAQLMSIQLSCERCGDANFSPTEDDTNDKIRYGDWLYVVSEAEFYCLKCQKCEQCYQCLMYDTKNEEYYCPICKS